MSFQLSHQLSAVGSLNGIDYNELNENRAMSYKKMIGRFLAKNPFHAFRLKFRTAKLLREPKGSYAKCEI